MMGNAILFYKKYFIAAQYHLQSTVTRNVADLVYSWLST